MRKREDIIDKCRECDKDRCIHNFKGCLYRVKQINLHLSEMEILAQPLWETLLPLDSRVFTPTTFRHTQKGCRSEFQNPPIKKFTSKTIFSSWKFLHFKFHKLTSSFTG
jgi:hypothetical protein